MKVLFICAANICRSRTAETLLAAGGKYFVKSCGMSKYAQVAVSQKLLDWADIVFVMNTWMKDMLAEKFKVAEEKVKVLHVVDGYYYGQPMLVKILTEKLREYGFEVDSTRAEAIFIDQLLEDRQGFQSRLFLVKEGDKT